MPVTSQKNLMMSPAVLDLGLGAQLQTSVQDSVEELKKKKLLQSKNQNQLSPAGISLLMNPQGNQYG